LPYFVATLYIIFEKFHTVGDNANVIRRIGFEKTNLKLVLDPLLALITHSLKSLLIHFYFDFIKKVNGVSIKKKHILLDQEHSHNLLNNKRTISVNEQKERRKKEPDYKTLN
jgi:hypothetical protein